jgi:hypothetical protein
MGEAEIWNWDILVPRKLRVGGENRKIKRRESRIRNTYVDCLRLQ